MWNFFAGLILRYRVAILVIMALLTGVMGYFSTTVGLSYEYGSVLPQEDTAFRQYSDFKSRFGEDANVLVVGLRDSLFFRKDHFDAFYALNDSLRAVDGVKGLLSVANAYDLDKDTAARALNLRKLIASKPASQAALDSIQKRIEDLPFYKNLFYNDSTHVYLVAITFDPVKLNSKKREKIVQNIENFVWAYAQATGSEPHFSGMPYVRTKSSVMVKNEMVKFVIIAALVTASILFFFFRSFKVVGFSMIVVFTGVIWSFGFMGMLGFKMTMLTVLIPSLMIVIGIPNCIFLLNKYHSEYRLHGNKIRALQRVIAKIGDAMFYTNVTTALGFVIISSSKLLQEFAIVAFSSTMGIFIIALLLVPPIFSFLSVPSEKQTKHLDARYLNSITDKLVHWVVRYRPIIYTTALGMLAAAIYGLSQMKSTGYMVDDLPKDNPILVDLKFLETNFHGVLPIEIVINTNKKKGVFNPKALKKIIALQDSLKKYPEISRSLSICDFLKFARQAYYNGNKAYYSMPNSFDQAFILEYLGGKKTGREKMFLDSAYQSTRITATVQDIGTERMHALEQSIQRDIDQIFRKDSKYTATVTGASVLFFKGTEYLVGNLGQNVALSLILVSLCMVGLLKNFRMVLLSLIPNLFPLLVTAGLMGYLGVSIKPSTILVFSIAYGISVDNTIHYLAKFHHQLRVCDWNIRLSVIAALKDASASIIYTSIVLFFGFGIFVFSQFGGTVALGAFVSMTLLVGMLANLLLLPAFLLTLDKFVNHKSFNEPLLVIFDEEEDIDTNELIIKPNNEETKSILP